VSTLSPERAARRTRRRQAGFLGLVLGCAALVEGKALTAPPTHKINLGAATLHPSSGPTNRAGSGTAGRRTSAAGASSASTAVRSVDGNPIDIGYGIVQVRVTLQQGRIADVTILQEPSGGRSGSIASYAVPELRREVLAAQSASIDTVSGASYTSDGYARSVQSALDSARA
jgi:uncharacterized protein with FMN-binding domain